MQNERVKKLNSELDEIFVRDKGIWKRFIKMLFKSRLPWIWIALYVVFSVFITNIGVSVNENTSEKMAGNLSFLGIILPYIGYSVINLIFAAFVTVIQYMAQARISRNLRRMVWGKVVKLPLSYYDKNNPKELITRITDDTSTISTLITQVIIPIFTGLYTLFVVFRKVGDYDTALMWSLLAVVPFVLAVAFMMGKLSFGISDTVNLRSAQYSRDVSEKLNAEQLIKSSATEEKEIQNGVAKMTAYFKASIKSSWIGQFRYPVYTIVGVLQTIAIVLIGRSFYSNGSITLAQWIAYLAFAQQIANQLQAYAGYWTSIKSSQGGTRRVTYIMDEKDEPSGTDVAADDMSGDFAFENVTFAYGEKAVLHDVSVTIPEGKITALVGRSGGGKTTMLNLLERFYPLESGAITVGGRNIAEYNMKSYRENIAYVTQESVMLTGTIRDNIVYGCKREVSEEEIVEAAKTANAYDFIAAFPEGLDTQVGENGSRLSGGQKQRIAIARAVLRKPRYLFLDEATGAMDAQAKDDVWKGLGNLMRDKTTVMIAHDYQTASHADHVIVVDDGAIADCGTPSDLMARNEFYRNFALGKEESV